MINNCSLTAHVRSTTKKRQIALLLHREVRSEPDGRPAPGSAGTSTARFHLYTRWRLCQQGAHRLPQPLDRSAKPTSEAQMETVLRARVKRHKSLLSQNMEGDPLSDTRSPNRKQQKKQRPCKAKKCKRRYKSLNVCHPAYRLKQKSLSRG